MPRISDKSTGAATRTSSMWVQHPRDLALRSRQASIDCLVPTAVKSRSRAANLACQSRLRIIMACTRRSCYMVEYPCHITLCNLNPPTLGACMTRLS